MRTRHAQPRPETPLTGLFVFLSFVGIAVFLLTLPWVPELKHINPSTTPLMQLREQQSALSGRRQRSQHTWKDLRDISPLLVHAVLLAEDDQFYRHKGFDFEQIQIALQKDWAKKRYVYGGSTLTQQLARTVYLTPRKTLLRKVREAAITVWMEQCLTKRRILELYLNLVEWGPGIYGAEAASQFFYHKSCADLTAEEAVALSSILPSPRRWTPNSEKIYIARRRTNIYQRMQEAGYVPPDPNSPEAPTRIDLNQLQQSSRIRPDPTHR